MKKQISVILVLMLILSLCACGKKDIAANKQSSVIDGKAFTALDNEKQRISDLKITAMEMSKQSYKPNEPITVTVSWTGTPLEDAWVGIVPADVPHGSEEENDNLDLDYVYISNYASGDAITFEITDLEKGDYTMRVHETDCGSVELAWCTFNVK